MIKQYAMPGSGRNFAKPHNYEGKKVIKGKTELKIIGHKGKNT